MAVATTHAVALVGSTGHVVDVQVDLSNGVVLTALVGRPDVSINEAKDRCRAAIGNTVFEAERRRWPSTKRVTILLSPADLPKRGPHFDLAIAVAVLAAADPDIPSAAMRGAAMIGELTLDGRLRCVPGVLPMAMAAAAQGLHTVYVPEPQVAEAAMVRGLQVFGVRSLGQVVALLAGEEVPEAPPVEPMSGAPLLSWRGEERLDDLDLRDVLGIPDVRYAVEVAAAGGHHLLLTGPKGSGKTTIAERIPGLLPDLSDEESLELTAVHSLCGALPPGATRITRPPFRSPHHSASRSGVLGGGTGRVRPGEVSKAHLGVLFMDEFPLFPSDVIEALREPLEAGEISISRGEDDAVYPARAMFVFACNPCRWRLRPFATPDVMQHPKPRAPARRRGPPRGETTVAGRKNAYRKKLFYIDGWEKPPPPAGFLSWIEFGKKNNLIVALDGGAAQCRNCGHEWMLDFYRRKGVLKLAKGSKLCPMKCNESRAPGGRLPEDEKRRRRARRRDQKMWFIMRSADRAGLEDLNRVFEEAHDAPDPMQYVEREQSHWRAVRKSRSQ